jgi:broad specificity phosphatase PhoE
VPMGFAQEIADEAKGDNVLIVTHWDGVNASVARLQPWAIVYPVKHTGFTVSYRDRQEGVPRFPIF